MAPPTHATESQCGGYHWKKAIADGTLPNSLSTWKQLAMLWLPFCGWEASIQKSQEGRQVNEHWVCLAFSFSDRGIFPTLQSLVVAAQRKVIFVSSHCECVSQDRCNQNSPKEGSGQKFFMFHYGSCMFPPPEQRMSPKLGERCEGG